MHQQFEYSWRLRLLLALIEIEKFQKRNFLAPPMSPELLLSNLESSMVKQNK